MTDTDGPLLQHGIKLNSQRPWMILAAARGGPQRDQIVEQIACEYVLRIGFVDGEIDRIFISAIP